MKLSNIPFKLESGAYRTLYRALGTKPSSAPYLSGDTFRSLCSLESIYQELSPRFESPALWFDSWKKTIGEKR